MGARAAELCPRSQVYGLSGPVARYIGRNGPILHRFANEDVTLGAWLVGLEVTHVDERRFCCDSAERCMAQARLAQISSVRQHLTELPLNPVCARCVGRKLSLPACTTQHRQRRTAEGGVHGDAMDNDNRQNIMLSSCGVCAQTNENNVCLSYYEHQCAGICSSESRLEPIYESCLKDPLNRLAAALAEQGEDLEDQ